MFQSGLIIIGYCKNTKMLVCLYIIGNKNDTQSAKGLNIKEVYQWRMNTMTELQTEFYSIPTGAWVLYLVEKITFAKFFPTLFI